MGDRQHVGDGAYADRDDSTLRDEVCICEVDALLKGDAEKNAKSIVQSDNEHTKMRVIIQRNDLKCGRKVLGNLREVDHQGSSDWISSTRPIPVALNQVSCIGSNNEIGLQRTNSQWQTIFVNVHDRENPRLTPRNVRSTVRRRVDFKQTLDILKTECSHDAFSVNNCKPRTVFSPHDEYAIKQVFRQV